MNKVSVIPWAMKIRKFYCCSCGEKLIPYPKTRIVKRGDPDYKEHSYFGRGKHLIGDIELTEYDFKCMACDKFISYDEQCVIEKIQKQIGTYTLSQDNINENIENARITLERKRKIQSVVSKVIGIAVAILILYCWLKSGNFPFKIYL